MKRIVVTTGGTGGHIFPALAAIERLKAENPDVEILFIGGSKGMEGKMAARAGLMFRALPVEGFLGRGIKALLGVFKLGISVLKSISILRKFSPNLVAGFGGYAGFPAVFAAWLINLPTVIHEQNRVPGVANRILGKRVKKVLLSFPDDQGFFPRMKTALTGNPIRNDIARIRNQTPVYRPSGERRLLVLGGSQGSRAINYAVCSALKDFREKGISIRHQTGEADYEKVRQAYSLCGMPEDCVFRFIEDVAGAYSWADLILCRSGATTLAEITACGKPAIFVPFPFATHNHQYENAKVLADAGAALLIEEKDLVNINPAEIVNDLFNTPEKLERMAGAAARFGKPDASLNVVDEMILAAGIPNAA